jgi:RimJ/RimL family protein N-acetyltransferase
MALDADAAQPLKREVSFLLNQADVPWEANLMTSIIGTHRLRLVPATVAHVRAEIGDRGEFARLLDASVPGNWPPESTVDALPLFLEWLEAAPESVGWFGWYALRHADGADQAVLVGGGGFLGPPREGQVNFGYSVLPQFQGAGFATEMAGALVQWAWQQRVATRIVAETEWANPASVRVLSKLGFVETGASTEPGGALFELSNIA